MKMSKFDKHAEVLRLDRCRLGDRNRTQEVVTLNITLLPAGVGGASHLFQNSRRRYALVHSLPKLVTKIAGLQSTFSEIC